MSTSIRTFTGRLFDPVSPRPEDVDVRDIAHALAHVCRFGGHTKDFVSVAQHSVLVSRAVPPAHALLGLLHDASEAYVGDIPSPWKANLRFATEDGEVIPFREAEGRIQQAIFSALAVPAGEAGWKAVKHADAVLLAAEARDLMPHSVIPFPEGAAHPRIEAWGPHRAKAEFMNRYAELTHGK